MRPLARPDRASDRFSEQIDVTYGIRKVIPDLVKRHARGAAVARSGLLTVGDGLQACAATSLDYLGGFPFTERRLTVWITELIAGLEPVACRSSAH